MCANFFSFFVFDFCIFFCSLIIRVFKIEQTERTTGNRLTLDLPQHAIKFSAINDLDFIKVLASKLYWFLILIRDFFFSLDAFYCGACAVNSLGDQSMNCGSCFICILQHANYRISIKNSRFSFFLFRSLSTCARFECINMECYLFGRVHLQLNFVNKAPKNKFASIEKLIRKKQFHSSNSFDLIAYRFSFVFTDFVLYPCGSNANNYGF